ncbi:MAG: amidohydrolase family protein, partial [Acidobacteriota bacterium]
MSESRMLVRGGTAVLPGGLRRADVLIEGTRIVGVGEGLAVDGAKVIDASGMTVGPGFIDVHVHGGGGHSFFTQDASRVEAYSDWAPKNGVTSFLASTVGRDADDTRAIFRGLAPAIGRKMGAEPLGFHMEGPFINPVRMGAFLPAMLRNPVPGAFESFQEAAGGHIRQVTLAPELPGAIELIHAVRQSG